MINRVQARIEVIVGAGHFYERGFGGYAFDEVVNLTTTWFDKTLIQREFPVRKGGGESRVARSATLIAHSRGHARKGVEFHKRKSRAVNRRRTR